MNFKDKLRTKPKLSKPCGRCHPATSARPLGLAGGMVQKPAVNIQVIQPDETGIISQWDADIQGQMAQEVQDD